MHKKRRAVEVEEGVKEELVGERKEASGGDMGLLARVAEAAPSSVQILGAGVGGVVWRWGGEGREKREEEGGF